MSRLDEAAAKRQTSGGGAQGWFLGAEVASHIHLLKFIQTRCDEHVHGCVCVCCACECVLCGVVPVVGLPSSFFSAAGMLGLRVCARACAVWGSAQPGASPFLLQPRQGDLAVPTSSLQWIAHS